jgi:hypothetical protein
MNKKYTSITIGALTSLAIAVPAFAQTPTANTFQRGAQDNGQQNTTRGSMMEGRGIKGNPMMVRPTISGTVTVINGNTITVSGHQGMASSSTQQTLFTVDASKAKVLKNNATSTITSIAIGDTLIVEGTLTNTNVVATVIRDGAMMGRGRENNEQRNSPTNTQSGMVQLEGNGQPVIAGTISVVNGTTLTVTTKSNVVYTIDASTSKIVVKNATSTLSSVAVGDMVIVQGAVNGTTVQASTLIDNGVAKTETNQPVKTNQKQNTQGFFSGIGGFFSRIFGF